MASYNPITNTLNFAVAFNPTTAFPLDARSMFGSYDAAVAAAATAENAGSSNTVYYFGQTLTVFENDVAKQYIIQGDKTLKEVGSSVVVDGKAIIMDDNSALTLKGWGKEYYKYHDADVIIETGDHTYPDNMPADAEAGNFIKIGETWYKYDGSAWVESGDEPKSTPYYVLTPGWKAGLEPKVVSASESQFELAWYEASSTTVEGLNKIVAGLQTEVESHTTRIGAVETKASANEEAISAEAERAKGIEQGLRTDVNANTAAITKLNSDESTEGSVKNQVAAAVAKIVSDAPEAYDTLKEIADWIVAHPEDTSAMNTQIQKNKSDIATINALLGTTLPEGITSTTVIDYIAEAVQKEKERAVAAEGGLNTTIQGIKAITDALGTASKKNIEDFATAAQGLKADSAVQSVTKGETNGHIKVDGTDVEVYTDSPASTSARGTVKVDGTTISATGDGTISVEKIPLAKVEGGQDAIDKAEEDALAAAKEYVGETSVVKTDIVASGGLAGSIEEASDTKVVSEKAMMSSLMWKDTM